jgi:imidazolonepropionase-like amidohydrolase
MMNNMMKLTLNAAKKYFIIGLLLASYIAKSQSPEPGLPQSETIVITGATIHIGNGIVYRQGQITFNNGKLLAIDSIVNTTNPKYKVINAAGKHIYPGLIAPNTTLGLNEIDAVRSTRDFSETGDNNAGVRSIIAYNADSKVTPTVRSNGVLLAQIVPTGGSISGISSVVQLDAWNWEDAAVKTDDALHLNWPQMSAHRGWWSEPGEAEKLQVDKEIKALEDIFEKAQTYCKGKPKEVNLKLEAFREVFAGKRKIFIHTDGAREIISAIQFMRKYQITPIIVGGNESHLITGFLRSQHVAVILIRTHNLPAHSDDDIDLPYKLPKILNDSGVLYCIADVGSWQQRNLPFQAGTAVAYGLTPEQALMAVSSNTAKILGIDARYGMLEKDKSATIILCDGDLLNVKTSKVNRAWIDGRELNLDNSQKQLDRKFRKKLFGE